MNRGADTSRSPKRGRRVGAHAASLLLLLLLLLSGGLKVRSLREDAARRALTEGSRQGSLQVGSPSRDAGETERATLQAAAPGGRRSPPIGFPAGPGAALAGSPELPPPVRVEAQRPGPAAPLPTSELLITLRPGTDAEAFARDHGLRLLSSLAGLSDIHVFGAPTPEAAKAARLQALADARVARAYLNERTQHVHCNWTTNDPYFPNGSPSASFHGQWHLNNGASTTHANVVAAWARDFTGQGVLLAIVDDCLETGHPDLSPNYAAADSWNFGNNTSDPNPNPAYDNTSNEDMHGTSVAGVMAARGGNGVGVTGAAPLSSVAGLRVDFPAQTMAMFVNATLYHSSGANTSIKVKNHSYGVSATYVDDSPENQAVSDSSAVGTIHLYAAGNERGTVDQDSNTHQLQNNPDAIAVAAIGSNGKFSSYSSFGANVLVASPSNGVSGFGITTTDRTGGHGYNRVSGGSDGDAFPDLNYTSTFGGTSSATPLVSGIMGLGKQVQPALDVRLAKHALVRSCKLVDPTDSSATGGGDGSTSGSAWKTNKAGFAFNQNYGFGLVDANGFVQQTLLYTGVTPLATETTGTVAVTGGAIPNNIPGGISRTFSISSTTPLEELLVTLDITHPHRGDLEAFLTSPKGTMGRLFMASSSDNGALPDPSWTTLTAWTFTTNQFWGENPSGTWTLMVHDIAAGNSGTWNSFAVTARLGTLISDTTPPGVVSITRSGATPTNAGSVTFTVKFSEPVTGVDPGDFALATTGTVSGAAVTGISGSLTTYTVTVATGTGDGTIRLDLIDNDTILDTAGNPLGGAGLGNGSYTSGPVYTIDKTPPSVANVSSTAADGIYSVGASLPVTLTFSEPVFVTGTPLLTLATGAGTPVNYASGTGSATLTFSYTVGAGQNSPHLDVVGTNSLSLNGGSIADLAGNAASLGLPAPGTAGSLSANKNLLVDTTPPTAPGAPVSVVAIANSGAFTLTWTAATDPGGSGVESYTVGRSSNGGASWVQAATGLAAASFTDGSLLQGSYLYRVEALDAAGNVGPWSANSAALIVDTSPPGAPGTPAASLSPNAGTYSVLWTAATDLGGSPSETYTVQRSADGGTTWIPVAAGIGRLSVAEMNVAEGSCLYRVQAQDAAGNIGAWSASSSPVIVDRTPPAVPGNVTGTPALNNTGTFSVTWSPATDTGGSVALSYTIERSSDGGASWAVAASGVSGTSLAQTTLPQGSYTYRVHAVDAVGNVGGTSAVSGAVVVDRTAPTIPGTPTGGISPNNSGTFALTWAASTDPGGSPSLSYSVQRSSNGGAGWTPVGTGLATAAFTDVGLAQGSYLYRVQAADSAGNLSAWSGASAPFVVDTTRPGAPGTPSASPSPTSGPFTVTWSAAADTGGAGVATYTLARSLNGGAFAPVASGVAAISLVQTGLPAGAYRYQVQAVDAAGNVGPWSAVSLAAVVDNSPPHTTILSSPPNPSSSAGALFTFTASVAGCTFQTKLDGAAAWTSIGTATVASYGGLANGPHTFQVRSTDLAGNVDPGPASYAWTVNSSGGVTTPPRTILTGTPPNPSSSTSAVFTFLSTEPGGSFDVQLDGGGWTTNAASTTRTYTSLSLGAHAFSVRAVDAASNVDASPPVYTWTIKAPPVDATAPLINLFSDGVSVNHWVLASTDPAVAWTVDGTPAGVPGAAFHTAPSSLNYNNGTDYDLPGLSNSGTATSPVIALGGLATPRLKFFCNYQTETTGTDHDIRTVQVSGDGFATLLVNETLSTVPGSSVAGPCAPMGQWHEHVIRLTGISGPVQVRFGFDTVDAAANQFGGWFIDDFEVSDLEVSGLNQFESGSSASLAVGGTITTRMVQVSGWVSQDALASVQLQVELQPIGTPFVGVATSTATASGAGAPISLNVTLPGEGSYHWQARTVAGTSTSAWMPFGLNAETDPDFVIGLPAPQATPAGGGGGGGGGCGALGLEALLFYGWRLLRRRRSVPDSSQNRRV